MLVGARLNLGALLLRLNKLAEATEVTSAVTRQLPEVMLGWYNLGLIQRKAGDIGRAIEAYQSGLQLDPNSQSCIKTWALPSWPAATLKRRAAAS